MSSALPLDQVGVTEVTIEDWTAIVRDEDGAVSADLNEGFGMNPTIAGQLRRLFHRRGCNPHWSHTSEAGITKRMVFVGASREVVADVMQIIGQQLTNSKKTRQLSPAS